MFHKRSYCSQEKNINLSNSRKSYTAFFKTSGKRWFSRRYARGNLFVDNDRNIVPVDFGIMGRLDKYNKIFSRNSLWIYKKRLCESSRGPFSGWTSSRNCIKGRICTSPKIQPIFGQNIKDISGGNLLSQLFEITEKFNMATQTQLLLLQKTMVVVEGVARKLRKQIFECFETYFKIG